MLASIRSMERSGLASRLVVARSRPAIAFAPASRRGSGAQDASPAILASSIKSEIRADPVEFGPHQRDTFCRLSGVDANASVCRCNRQVVGQFDTLRIKTSARLLRSEA